MDNDTKKPPETFNCVFATPEQGQDTSLNMQLAGDVVHVLNYTSEHTSHDGLAYHITVLAAAMQLLGELRPDRSETSGAFLTRIATGVCVAVQYMSAETSAIIQKRVGSPEIAVGTPLVSLTLLPDMQKRLKEPSQEPTPTLGPTSKDITRFN